MSNNNQQKNSSNFIFYSLIISLFFLLFGTILVCFNSFAKTNNRIVKDEKKVKDIELQTVENVNNIHELQNQNNEQIKEINQSFAAIQTAFDKMKINIGNNAKNTNGKSNTLSNTVDSSSAIGSEFKPTKLDDCPNFNNLIGMKDAKTLVKPFLNYIKDKSEFDNRGKIELSDGLLMYGVGGTGKTVFARSIAKEANLPFYEVSCASFSKPIKGQAPKMVRDLFDVLRIEAQKGNGAILFLDECESIFLDISKLPLESEVRNVVNEYKVQLENYKDQNNPIFVIGATNNLKDIDPAILSRFSNKLEIKPDEFDGRQEQLKFILEKTHKFPITADAKEYVLNTINKSLDFLPPKDEYKKAYRVLLKLLNTANGLSIQRAIDAKQINESCKNPQHNTLIKNNDIFITNNKNKVKTDANILGNCCSCKAITIDDLKNSCISTINNPEALTKAEEFFKSQKPIVNSNTTSI